MSYKTIYDTARDTQAIERLTVAVAEVARDIYTEDAGTANHDLRMALVAHAGPTFSQFRNFAKEMALLVFALNQEMDLESTDQELYNAVSGLWNAYAALLQARGTITVEQAPA